MKTDKNLTKSNQTKKTNIQPKAMLSVAFKTAVFFGGCLFVALFLFAPQPEQHEGFETINELINDAAQKDEFAQPEDYNDHRLPSWKTYQNKHYTSWFTRRLTNLLLFLRLISCGPFLNLFNAAL